ncbi:unnamed protein product [Tilletia controversa]|nr:unnamed protein product [Tilletia controversa]
MSSSASARTDGIREWHSQFAAAEAWLNGTGQGQLDAAAKLGEVQYRVVEQGIMAYVYKKCPFYDELSPVLKDRASVNPTFSHSTGDGDDPAVAALQQRASAPAGEDGASSPEEFYPGWDDTHTQSQTQGAREDANAPAENNNGQTATSGTADRPSASAARSASAAPGASAAPAASVGGAPTTPVAGPARPKLKAATPALEKAKKEAAQSKGKWYLIQTMSVHKHHMEG